MRHSLSTALPRIFNFAYNGNKVLQENIPEQQTTPGREGYPVGAIFALKTAGVNKETGNMMFYNPEGEKVTLKQHLEILSRSPKERFL